MECIVSKQFRFEASHVLPRHPGKCSRLHGHSWLLTVSVVGEVKEETGFVVDYADLKRVVDNEIIERLDHTHLGYGTILHSSAVHPGTLWAEGPEPPFGKAFYPSSENLVIAIGRMLQPLVKELKNGTARLYEVSLDETCTSRATWRPATD